MEQISFQRFSMNQTIGLSENKSMSLQGNQTRHTMREELVFKSIKLFFYCIVFIVGIIGNVLVFRIIVGKRRLRTVSNFFICNLAAADIAVVTVNLPFRLAYQENGYVWPFGLFLCKVIPTLTYVFINASSATLVLMSFDKHRAIVQPLKPRLSLKQTKIAIFFIWIASVLITLPFYFVLELRHANKKLVCTDNWPSIEFERAYFVVLVFVQFVTPMTIISTTYINMCTHLRLAERNENLSISRKQRRRRNKKVIKMLIVIVVVYAACTLPWHITWLFSVYGYSDSVAKKICVLLVISVSAAHPIIYGTLNKDFARGFLGYTSCACSNKLPTVSGSFLRRRRKTIRKNTTRRFELQYDANNHDLNNVVQVSFTEDYYKDSAHAEIETVV